MVNTIRIVSSRVNFLLYLLVIQQHENGLECDQQTRTAEKAPPREEPSRPLSEQLVTRLRSFT